MNVVGAEGFAVVERHALLEMERPDGGVVVDRPGLGELRLRDAVFANPDQGFRDGETHLAGADAIRGRVPRRRESSCIRCAAWPPRARDGVGCRLGTGLAVDGFVGWRGTACQAKRDS